MLQRVCRRWRYKAMIFVGGGGGFFFFVKSMKEIIHPVPASWMEASSVRILLKCLQPSLTRIASRVTTKSPDGFHPGLPIENTCKSTYYGDVTLIIPVSPAYAAATYTSSPELFISFAMQPTKDCKTCIPPGSTITFLNCIG